MGFKPIHTNHKHKWESKCLYCFTFISTEKVTHKENLCFVLHVSNRNDHKKGNLNCTRATTIKLRVWVGNSHLTTKLYCFERHKNNVIVFCNKNLFLTCGTRKLSQMTTQVRAFAFVSLDEIVNYDMSWHGSSQTSLTHFFPSLS